MTDSIRAVQVILPGEKGDPGDLGPPGPPMNPKPAVATVAALPTSGNTAGDFRTVVENGHGYGWNGSAWVDIGQYQGPPGEGGAPTIQRNGTVVAAAADTINVRGGTKTVEDFSGITAIFLPTVHDIRAYGAVTNDDATAQGMSAAARRAANNTAIQAAMTAGANVGNKSRRIRIPGAYGDIYEFDTTLTFGNGVILATDHEAPSGARLHYYGAVDTDAFQGPANTTYLGMIGVRLEDMRGSAAATGTGRGIELTQCFNDLIFEQCFVIGFYDLLYAFQSDCLKVEGGWWIDARHYGLHTSNCTNYVVITDLAVGNHVATYPTMERAIFIESGDRGSTARIDAVKCEADNAALTLLWLRTSMAVSARNVGQRQASAKIADVVRIEDTSASTAGAGATVTLDNIVATGGSATNLLHHTEAQLAIDTTIPCHTSGDCRIVHWSSGSRELAKAARPGGGAYSWTQGAAGTSVVGTVVPDTGAGTGATVTCDGDDMQGMLTVVTGTSPQAQRNIVGLNFRVPWPEDIKGVVLTPGNEAASALTGAQQIHVGEASLSRIGRRYFRLYSGATALAASTTYKWHYRVLP